MLNYYFQALTQTFSLPISDDSEKEKFKREVNEEITKQVNEQMLKFVERIYPQGLVEICFSSYFVKNIRYKIIWKETYTRQASSSDVNLLAPNAPPGFESVDSFFKDILPESESETTNTKEQSVTEPPPAYEETFQKDDVIIAQNQVTLVHDNQERTIIEKNDTEAHLTIRRIREYLRDRLNANQVELSYRDRVLANDNDTLAESGWVPGECGTIIVRPVFEVWIDACFSHSFAF